MNKIISLIGFWARQIDASFLTVSLCGQRTWKDNNFRYRRIASPLANDLSVSDFSVSYFIKHRYLIEKINYFHSEAHTAQENRIVSGKLDRATLKSWYKLDSLCTRFLTFQF